MKTTFFLLSAIGAQACMRERSFVYHNHDHVKRQSNAAFPPVLDANERILIDSFDNSSISTWSYYYTHGNHIAGRNRTMAQWTADRWTEFGFTSRLDEYSKHCAKADGDGNTHNVQTSSSTTRSLTL